MSAFAGQSSDDLTIETGKIKEELVVYKTELDQCNAAVSKVQDEVAGLQEVAGTQAETKIKELLGDSDFAKKTG